MRFFDYLGIGFLIVWLFAGADATAWAPWTVALTKPSTPMSR